jgi:Holliday junction resolvase-like predicted endonuclease
MYVTKTSGSKEEFRREKVENTCIRMGFSSKIARKVADKVESQIYDGIPTKEIMDMIFNFLSKYKAGMKHRIDLRSAITFLRPKPDFEEFVRIALKEDGYETLAPSGFVKGKCIEHEIDGILKKDKEIIFLEVKHQANWNAFIPLDVVLETRAVLEDLIEGFKLGYHQTNFTKAMIVCNTKFSIFAIKYGMCAGILLKGWNVPLNEGLEYIIERAKLYPITILKDLDEKSKEVLCNAGILLLKQLITVDKKELSEKTEIDYKLLNEFSKKAEKILG